MGGIRRNIRKNGWALNNKHSLLVLNNQPYDNYIPVEFMLTKPYFRKNKGFGKEVFAEAIKFVKEEGFSGILVERGQLTDMAKGILDKYVDENRGILQTINSNMYYVFTDENKI